MIVTLPGGLALLTDEQARGVCCQCGRAVALGIIRVEYAGTTVTCLDCEAKR